MAGERPSAQPGGRPPAPGELAVVQAFINSHYDLEVERGADLFATPTALKHWLLTRGLIEPARRVGSRELRRALEMREALRELARANPDGKARAEALSILNHIATGAPVELRFEARGPRFDGSPAPGMRGAQGRLLAMTARAMIDGTWWRLKVCPGDHCGWAFYDYSRNLSGRWCSMAVCGGRAKARAHYWRRRE